MGRSLVRVMTALFSFLAVFLAVEGLLWLAGVVPPILHFGSPRIYQPDTELIYAMRPGGAIDTNSLGLRGPEIFEATGKVRLIALGDSYTYGHQLDYESSYPALLEERLNRRGPPTENGFEVINAGVPGYNVDQAYALFTRRLAGLNPDWLVLIIEPKDLAGANVLFDLEGEELVPVSGWKNWIYLQLWLRTHTPDWIKRTHLYRFLVGRLAGSDPFGTIGFRDLDEQIQWQIDKIERLVGDLVARGERDGYEVLVVNYPDRPALLHGGDYRRSTYFGLPVHILGPRGNLHMERLRDVIGASGAHFIDGMDIFVERDHEAGELDALFLWDDPHMSRAGNEELAEIVAEEIARISVGAALHQPGERSEPLREGENGPEPR